MELYYPIILDGATGTELQKRGYTGDISAEQWVLEHPKEMIEIQKGYLEAGSDIVYAPTFSANSIKLQEHGLANKVDEYNKRLVEISKKACDKKGYVAADMSPLGQFLYPYGEMHFEEMVDVYSQQAKALQEAQVDLFVVETMMSLAEARAAVLAIRKYSDKPIFVSFTCDQNGKTLSGGDVVAIGEIMESMEIEAFGLNCSVGPEQMVSQIKRLAEYAKVPLISKPNAGLPKTRAGKTYYDFTPEQFTEHLPELIAAGVKIFGGCCGTNKNHIALLKEKLSQYKIENPPIIENKQLILANEKELYVLQSDASIEAYFAADENLEDNLLSFEGNLLAIEINNEEQLAAFEQCQGIVNGGLCIQCDDANLLEKALRIYQGKCMVQSNADQSILNQLQKKYGCIY